MFTTNCLRILRSSSMETPKRSLLLVVGPLPKQQSPWRTAYTAYHPPNLNFPWESSSEMNFRLTLSSNFGISVGANSHSEVIAILIQARYMIVSR